MKILLEEVTSSEEETIEFGKKIIKKIPKKINLVILQGELGAGKTALVKGMASEMGIKEVITSPTYGYKKTYKGMVHYDLFLIEKINSKELFALIQEDLEENFVLIEWGEKLPVIPNSILVKIKRISEIGRKIKVVER